MKKCLILWTLVLSVLASINAADKHPPFSWDTVPVYAHFGIGTGLEPEEYDFVADRFDFVALTAGVVKRGDSCEKYIGQGAQEIKKRNPDVKVLFYWCPCQTKRAWGLFNENFPEGGFMPDNEQYDVTNKELRDWWTDWAKVAAEDYSCDGLFLDGLCQGQPTFLWSRRYGEDKAAEMDDAMIQMMKEAKTKITGEKLFIFNELHAPDGYRYFEVTDGAMIADFDRAPNVKRQGVDYLAGTIEAARKSGREGKIVIFKTWPEFTWWSDKEMMKKPMEDIHQVAKERITFPLACFLVAAEKYSYFCYSWGWLPEWGSLVWYPEFDKPLGPPKGQAVRKGWTYRREFEHASVFVDLETKEAMIDWKKEPVEYRSSGVFKKQNTAKKTQAVKASNNRKDLTEEELAAKRARAAAVSPEEKAEKRRRKELREQAAKEN